MITWIWIAVAVVVAVLYAMSVSGKIQVAPPKSGCSQCPNKKTE